MGQKTCWCLASETISDKYTPKNLLVFGVEIEILGKWAKILANLWRQKAITAKYTPKACKILGVNCM